MFSKEDSSLVLQSNNNNKLRNNEICHLNTKLLSEINLKCKIEEECTIPLIFSGIRDSIEIIRCNDGKKITEIKESNIKYIKWFIPAKNLKIFSSSIQDEQFGIVTVDYNNNLGFYPKLYDKIEFKTNVVGINTSYHRDLNGNIRLSVLVVESNGNISKWIPSENSKIISKNLIRKQIKFISDVNLILELNNFMVTSDCDSNDNNLRDYCKYKLNNLEEYLKLNQKLFIVTYDQVCIVDTTNLDLVKTISTSGSITSIYPYVKEKPRLLVVAKEIEVLELSECKSIYKYGHDSEEFGDYEGIDVSEVLYARVELNNEELLIISTRYNRIYILNTVNSVITSFINISTSKLYVYYYVESSDSEYGQENGYTSANGSIGEIEAENIVGSGYGQEKIVKYGLIGIDENSLVGFDTFKLSLLYSKLSIPDKIDVMANSQLMPNLLLASSKNDLMQLDLHYSHQAGIGRRFGGISSNKLSSNGNNSTNSSKKIETSGIIKNNMEMSGMEGFRSTFNVDYYKCLDRNTSRILKNNMASIKYINITNSTNRSSNSDRDNDRSSNNSQSNDKHVSGSGQRSRSVNKTVTCMTFHPRLPNICSIGYSDGSLYLLFMEHENISLFNCVFVHKFKYAVRNLVWYLVPKSLNYTSEYEGYVSSMESVPNKWNKKGCSNLMERIYKSISSSKYITILLVQLDSYGMEKHNMTSEDGSVYYMKLGENKVYNLKRSILKSSQVSYANSNYDTSNSENSQMDSINGENDIGDGMLFNIFVIQYPPLNVLNENNDNEEGNDGESYVKGYNNFSVVFDHVCLSHYSENSVTLTLLVIDLYLRPTVIKRFKIRVKGAVTNILVTNKQYNQYHLYADRYLKNTSMGSFSKGDLDHTSLSICEDDHDNCKNDTGQEDDNRNNNMDEDVNTVNGDINRFDKCVNSMQQYIIITTNLGRIYVTSLLRMYNNFLLVDANKGKGNEFDVDETKGEIVTEFKDDYNTDRLKNDEEDLKMDETFIGSGNITNLDHTILFSPTSTPLTEESNNKGSGCLCSTNCHFIIVVGMNNLILFYTLDVDHGSDRLKLVLFHVKKVKYNSFLVINEPFNYFKLLVNGSSSLLQYHFNHTQISSFLSRNYTEKVDKTDDS